MWPIIEVLKYQVIPREFAFEEFENYVFVGSRRAGKSYLLYQRIQLMIITRDEEQILEIGGKRIEVVPVWKWLLNN